MLGDGVHARREARGGGAEARKDKVFRLITWKGGAVSGLGSELRMRTEDRTTWTQVKRDEQ